MRKLIFGLLFAFLAISMAQPVEFFSMDGRLADPCVNEQHLDLLQKDCAANSELPSSATTYLLSAQNGAAATPVTIFGNLFTTGMQFKLAKIDAPETCTTVATEATIPAILGLVAGDGKSLTIDIATNWNTYITGPAVTERVSRFLCWSPNGIDYIWTGLRIGVVYACSDSPVVSMSCSNAAHKSATMGKYDTYLTATMSATDLATIKAIFTSQTVCCGGTRQTTNVVAQCINANVQSCCGSVAVNVGERCCTSSAEITSFQDGICPCTAVATNTCPSGESCCLPTKYNKNLASTDVNKRGQCYNPRIHRCCDTGKRYDPGSDQCCVINGIQSINVPCPCASAADCLGSQVGYRLGGGHYASGAGNTDMQCCLPQAPQVAEFDYTTTNGVSTFSNSTCNVYQNFPSGTGHYSVQQCPGFCIDTTFQLCCNGRACARSFEKCCNSTCCNRFSGTCQSGTLRQGSSRNNFVEYGIIYDQCTTVEQIDLIRAWWMFVHPTYLLIGTLTCLAIALVFAGRVEHAARRGLEKGMIVSAIISIMFSCCLYFAPLYKYGIVIVMISCFAILTAAARKTGMYIACIVLHAFLIVYLIDPFHGNDYLNLAIDRLDNGRTDPYSAGLWHSTSKIWDWPERCWDFYNGYFRLDPLIRDQMRADEPNNSSFGYCSRGWVSALLVFDGFIIISVILQFVLSIITFLIRGRMLKEVTVL